ncbi:serine O-acetyltransferase [Ereboglobus sp. PH5-10]|uniref:serine O-acetyltransferase n=1 Tax=Ereboglobus sp. PH5-10 TaxID=2940629 RepID=UPI00240610B6|nr:serine O-acetyltransferase [Ereboglobus sp. PH5-10]MDF9826157.1 serine O-acetyltransferase [Ereboglobus sp. PH5-10]
MNLENIKRALLASYQNEGGINHLEGSNLPAEESINQLARDFMYVLFPGFFGEDALGKKDMQAFVDRMLERIETRLANDIRKSLVFAGVEDAETRAKEKTMALLERLPELRRVIQTDVVAAYEGDPAARSVEEIILAYPCVLVISLQRIAHELYLLNVPLLPRMLTEYGHERTGTDIHPGATIGTHFFIDHCTGVVIGETARIGNHVKIYQGVTLGAKSFELDEKGHPIKGVKRHPELRDNVIVYPGATILGGDTVIGENSIVGSNVWLMQSMPANSIAYYQGDAASVIRPRSTKEQLLGETGD